MTKPMTPERLQQIKARRQNITMGDGDWQRMKYFDGSVMPDCISAGQTKKGYSLDVIISEDEKPENMDFIVHCPADIDDCIAEIERLTVDRDKWKKEAERLVMIMAHSREQK